MEKGFVKWFSETHGFGFITDSDTKKDIFFHFTGTLDKVKGADEVSYEIEEADRGPRAIKIRRIKDSKDGNR
jgi:Cold shock proteins